MKKFYSVWPDTRKIVQLLKKDKAVAHNQKCFFFAADGGSSRVVEEFIRQGADVNQSDQNGFTALYHATTSRKVANVKVLLKAGAEPTDFFSLWSIVDSGPGTGSPKRLEILNLLIDAGADINKPFDDEGYNLFARASDCDDGEVLSILESHGGCFSETYVNTEPAPELDLTTMQRRLVRALKKAWAEVKRERKGERFYLFGLETDSDCVVLTPFCNTEEQVEIDLGTKIEKAPKLKFEMLPGYTLYGAGKEHLSSIEDEINGRDTTKSSTTKKILRIFEKALVELDEKKFFDSGKNRDKVVLKLAKIDPDEKEQKELSRIIKRINPPISFQKYMDAFS